MRRTDSPSTTGAQTRSLSHAKPETSAQKKGRPNGSSFSTINRLLVSVVLRFVRSSNCYSNVIGLILTQCLQFNTDLR